MRAGWRADISINLYATVMIAEEVADLKARVTALEGGGGGSGDEDEEQQVDCSSITNKNECKAAKCTYIIRRFAIKNLKTLCGLILAILSPFPSVLWQYCLPPSSLSILIFSTSPRHLASVLMFLISLMV
jgi:hypothetical protein